MAKDAPPPPHDASAGSPPDGLAVAAVILGILSVAAPASIFVYPPAMILWMLLGLMSMFLVIPVLVILGLAAAVMGVVALRSGQPRWLSIGGIGTGMVGGTANILVPLYFMPLARWLA